MIGGRNGGGGDPGGGLIGGMDHGQRPVRADRLAQTGQAVKAHARVDRLARPHPPATKGHDGMAKRGHVDPRDMARRRSHGADDGGARQMSLGALQQVRGAALRDDHAGETLGGGAAVDRALQPLGALPGQRQRLGRKGQRQIAQRARLALQDADRLGHFQRVAGAAGQGLVHVGDQRRRAAARAIRGLDQRMGQPFGAVGLPEDRARAGFHVQDQRIQPRGQLLGQDRGGDQVNGFHRPRFVADRVEPPVGGGEFARRRDDGAAHLTGDAAQIILGLVAKIAGDRLQLVQRAAGMAQPPPRDHRHETAPRRQQRRKDQADRIPDAAGRMLVHDRAGQVPMQHMPRIAHRPRQRHPARHAKATRQHRHRESPRLRVADRPVGQTLRDQRGAGPVQAAPVAHRRNHRAGIGHVRAM